MNIEEIKLILDRCEGWCNETKGMALYNLVVTKKPRLVVEIGVFGGRSLIAMGFGIKENRIGHAFGIDPYSARESIATIPDDNKSEHQRWWNELDHERIFSGAMDQIALNGLEGFVSICRATSEQASPWFHEIDIVHIDGGHEESNAVKDVNMWLPNVRSGGIVLLDDCDWPSVKKAHDLLMEKCVKVGMTDRTGIFQKQ